MTDALPMTDPCPCGPTAWHCRIPHLFRFHAPQFVFEPACRAHDLAYTLGGTPTTRLYADRLFYGTMKSEISRRPWWQRTYLRLFAWIYYRAVRHYGAAHFSYHP